MTEDALMLEQAMQAHRAGRLEAAAALYQRILEREPGNLRAARLAGMLAREQGRLDHARRVFEAALAAEPADPLLQGEYGLTLLAAGDLEGAERALRAARSGAPADPRILANLGAVLLYRGRIQAAIDVQRSLVELQPDDPEALCNLAQSLLEAGEGEAALAALDDALDFAPGQPQVLAARGAVLCALEDWSAALPALTDSLAANPGDDIALTNLGYALAALGRHEAAAGTLQRAISVNPDNARATADLLNLLHRLGRSPEADRLGQQFLLRHPGERLVLAAHALLLHDLGQDVAAARVLDAGELVLSEPVNAVPGFDDVASFNAALGDCIAGQPLLEEPLSKATRGGSQSGELDLDAHPALSAFRALVAGAVERMTLQLQARFDPDHPLLIHAGCEWRLRCWATLLAAGGQQTPHMHPQAWLSGVYYVSVPEEIGSVHEDESGFIEFGAAPERLFVARPPATRRIRPEAGRMLLFPSWLYHSTLPFQASQLRISLAFDVVPVTG
ncbi:MAG: tetratricopeptide repeat protein [Chromatiales bacterium]|nr:tetratricopeptide repeat protein [Chromatiales bacterium]